MDRFYLPHILESAGLREIYSALLGNGIGGIVNFVATVCVLFYVSIYTQLWREQKRAQIFFL